ncbi:hypothetical protein [Streptomyces sp. 3N207]|uniref:hypothetical protein n=1 Tax=Streptomyces sp. 3N207 TaxID=3457417 RepID=UPI003FD153F4
MKSRSNEEGEAMVRTRNRPAVLAAAAATSALLLTAVALGSASATSPGSEEPAKAAVQAAPAADSTRESWQPPTDQSLGRRNLAAEQDKVNTDFLISDVSPGQFKGWWYQSHIKGVNVTWMAPSGRDPYDGWDWIEILDSNGKRVTWDWACGTSHCGAYGSTLIDTKLTKGMEYKALYWSDGGRITKGTLQAEFEFWA